MRTLVELQERSKAALSREVLMQIAENHAPSCAYETAVQNGWSEEQAQSCRFLSMIRRDHGDKVFKDTVEFAKNNDVAKYLDDNVISRVRLLETVIGQPMLIVWPEPKDLIFGRWLQQALPHEIKVTAKCGDFTISIDIGLGALLGNEEESFPEVKFSVRNAEDKEITCCSWSTLGSDNEKQNDPHCRRRRSYQDLAQVLGDRDSYLLYERKYKSIIMAVLGELERKGEVLPERLNKVKNIQTLVEQGDVEQLKSAITKLREKAVSDGVKPKFVACLDFEAREKIVEAERVRRFKDTTVPLLNKVVDNTVRGCIGAVAVPGTAVAKRYNFFLFFEGGVVVEQWLKILETNGYGGSMLFYSFNQPSGFTLAETGQLDAVILDDSIGWSSKRWWLDQLQEILREKGLKPIPQFADGEYSSSPIKFSEFSKQLPLA